MITTLHVLSIGSPETAGLVRDVLVLRTRCRLCVAKCTWDLPVVAGSEEIDVAILHDTFSLRELRIFAAYIRCRWPHARILLIQEKCESLDHGMYDERVAPGISAEPLLAVIERLAASARRGRRPPLNKACSYQRPRQGKTEMTENHSILKKRMTS